MGSLRIYEIAQRIGASSSEVLAVLGELGHSARSASSSVSDEIAAAVAEKMGAPVGTPTPPDTAGAAAGRDDVGALILEAFARARLAKPAGWQTMTLAVLKNRLIQISDGAFSEKALGFTNLRDFAKSYSDLLTLDESARPVAVTLKRDDSVAVPLPTNIKRSGRIRRDLWNAVMDYSSDHRWVWSGQEAVPESDFTSDWPVLPTVAKADLRSWREEFAAFHQAEVEADSLEHWVDSHGKTQMLPRPLQISWNALLKSKVLEILEAWFTEHHATMPSDVITSAVGERQSTSPQAPATPSDSLRAFIVGCIATMTDEELAEFALPARAVHRYVERKR